MKPRRHWLKHDNAISKQYQRKKIKRIRATSLFVLSDGSPSTYKVLEASRGSGIVSGPGLETESIGNWPPKLTLRPFRARSGPPPTPLRCPMVEGSPREWPGNSPTPLANPTPPITLASPELNEVSCFTIKQDDSFQQTTSDS